MVGQIEILVENFVPTVCDLKSVPIQSRIQLSFRFPNVNQLTESTFNTIDEVCRSAV